MILADTYLTADPAWPWNPQGLGMTALAGVAVLLAALTVWTYVGVRGASPRRVGLVLLLRLLALVIAFIVILRPSLAVEEEDNVQPSRVFILLDYSESMKITDEFNSLSRWTNARRILDTPAVKDVLKKLTAARVEIVYYQGAEDLRKYDPATQPTGKATDMGTWLHEFSQRHGREPNLKGLILLSDGADNGTRHPTLEKAAQLRGSVPIFAFGLGRPTTTSKQNDIDLFDIKVEPDPIPVKGKITVKGYANAPGFENSIVTVRMGIQELGAKEPRWYPATKQVLTKTLRNELVITQDAPETAGEVKVLLKIEPREGEVSVLNNEVSTFATVTKEGVRILWVEGRKPRFESTYAMRYGLANDRRFRVFFTELLNEAKPGAEVADAFDFDRVHYDVIVLGDISARRFAGGDPEMFKKVQKLITEKGTGLLLMGGYETLGADESDWHQDAARPLTSLLPVDLDKRGQVEGKLRVQPTKAGDEFLLRLDEDPKTNANLWARIFEPLDGVTNLGTVKPTSTIFAFGELNKEPVLVGATAGNGRILVFAGDTTWKSWRRSPEAVPAHARFWKQVMLYLARQEHLDSNVQITLDRRRVPADSNQRVGFTLKARGKNGLDVKNPQFTVKVIGPNKEETDVPVSLDGGEYRGFFLKTDAAGTYRLEAGVKGRDTEGNELSAKPSAAHFLGYAQDRETMRPAADHEFLTKIADTSGGRFALADERKLASLLEEFLQQREMQPRAKVNHWPDWRGNPTSDSTGDQLAALWNSTALVCFVLFVGLLCTEWYLRRRWGLV